MSSASEVPVNIQPKCFCNCYNMLAWGNLFKAEVDVSPINNKPYSCGRCEKGFSPDDNVVVHNLLHTLNILKNFHVFNKDAFTKMYLTTYNIIHADKKLRSPKEIGTTNEYLSSDNDVECYSAGDVSNTSESLKNNKKHSDSNLLKKNSVEYPFPCPLCDKKFKQESELSVHRSIHVNKDFHKCVQCDSVFKKESELISHMQCHDKEIPYCCGLCSKLFTTKGTLIAHVRNHYDEKNPCTYSCKACEKSFICKEDVIQHLSVHAMRSPCDKCKKLYKLRNGVSFYYCGHTLGKRHVCMTCNKRFSLLRCLKRHLQTHSTERPYVCNVCKKAYTLKNSLYAHYIRVPTHNITHPATAEVATNVIADSFLPEDAEKNIIMCT